MELGTAGLPGMLACWLIFAAISSDHVLVSWIPGFDCGIWAGLTFTFDHLLKTNKRCRHSSSLFPL